MLSNTFYGIIGLGAIISVAGFIFFVPPAYGETWYPGEGLKQGDYFKYSVCYIDWNNCIPFELHLWVKNQTSDGSGWNLELIAFDGSIIEKGVMTIGMVTPDPMYSDPNISDYSNVYKNTIAWLDSCSNRDDPKDFGLPAWCRNGGVGGAPVVPEDQEDVTVQAGSYKAWVIGWHKGVDSKIWVVPNIPFPVKAEVYADTTTVPIPYQYTLNLEQIGNNSTEPAIFKTNSTGMHFNRNCTEPNIQQDSVHNSVTTDTGSMIVEYFFSPSKPKQGCPVEFRLSFEKSFDPTQKYSAIHYDIFTVNDQGQKLDSEAQDRGRPDLVAPVGDDDTRVTIKQPPPLTHYVIYVSGVDTGSGNFDTSLSGLVKVDINTVPIPEFGSLVPVVLAIAIISIIVASTRTGLRFSLK